MKNRNITLTISHPRNPLVAAAHFRKAGVHHVGRPTLRQRAVQTLERELDKLYPPYP